MIYSEHVAQYWVYFRCSGQYGDRPKLLREFDEDTGIRLYEYDSGTLCLNEYGSSVILKSVKLDGDESVVTELYESSYDDMETAPEIINLEQYYNPEYLYDEIQFVELDVGQL